MICIFYDPDQSEDIEFDLMVGYFVNSLLLGILACDIHCNNSSYIVDKNITEIPAQFTSIQFKKISLTQLITLYSILILNNYVSMDAKQNYVIVALQCYTQFSQKTN